MPYICYCCALPEPCRDCRRRRIGTSVQVFNTTYANNGTDQSPSNDRVGKVAKDIVRLGYRLFSHARRGKGDTRGYHMENVLTA